MKVADDEVETIVDMVVTIAGVALGDPEEGETERRPYATTRVFRLEFENMRDALQALEDMTFNSRAIHSEKLGAVREVTDDEAAQRVVDRVAVGGLMRCCLETVEDLYPNGPARTATEGQTLQCKYASDNPDHRMIFRAGVWRWDHELPEEPRYT